ncbi:MAG: ATP-binding protein, partial [Methanoregulaceae archaeon]|nr:ATP-binding protein [Methanoregulaceae archaeon]
MEETYDASHITVLEGLQPVRERPAMYIGSTDTRGLHHLVYEVVDNSIDEALAGYCTLIMVKINRDGSCTIVDNGRGIPVDTMAKGGKSALETVLTVLHAGGKFDKATYQVSGGLHGVGVSVVNALSRRLLARVYRDGYVYEMSFERGKPVTPISKRKESPEEISAREEAWYGAERTGTECSDDPAEAVQAPGAVIEAAKATESPANSSTNTAGTAAGPGAMPIANSITITAGAASTGNRTAMVHRLLGTCITFMPDEAIFETTQFDYDVLQHRLRELAFLNSGLTIRIRDERTGDGASYCYHGGIKEFVSFLNTGTNPVHPDVVVLERKDPENKLEVEVGLQYTDTYSEQVYTFVNSVNTREGGTHLEGFRSAITRAINSAARKNNLIKDANLSIKGEDVREGLTAVISLKLAEPQFEGQTKMRLGNSNVKGI